MFMSKLSDFLNKSCKLWIERNGGNKSQADFVRWLDFPQTTYSNWIHSDVIPKKSVIKQLAEKLGEDVYWAADMIPPSIEEELSGFPPEDRKKLLSIAFEAIKRTRSKGTDIFSLSENEQLSILKDILNEFSS